jgi:hypothetical protein
MKQQTLGLHSSLRRRSFKPRFEALEDRTLLNIGQWLSFARNPQHTALAPVASQSLDAIHWFTPVDNAPVYSGNDLLEHYGSPLITASNTVIVPLRYTDPSTGAVYWTVEALNGKDSTVKWFLNPTLSTYIMPPHNWMPEYQPVITPNNVLVIPTGGGTVTLFNNADNPSLANTIAFYGTANYNANPAAWISSVFIDTPITSDSAGDIFFGFQSTGTAPAPLTGIRGGIARIDATGTSSLWLAANSMGDPTMLKVAQNSAPALSNDQSVLYIAINNADDINTTFGSGDLVALNSTTLVPLEWVPLRDPKSSTPTNPVNAFVTDDGSASPLVGPDGDVYFGVLENPFPSNNDRGWLLHYNSTLTAEGAVGAFGWDDTPSIVPKSMVPTYHTTSPYLLAAKYNDYAGVGTGPNPGQGDNRVAILDPDVPALDPISGDFTMNVVESILGPTPDDAQTGSFPNAVKEWCINSMVVDPFTDSILVNSEDGNLYRWNLGLDPSTQLNRWKQGDDSINLTSGLGEAYTPTVVGPDGTVYAISNATLFSVGSESISINDVTKANPGPGDTKFIFTVSLSQSNLQTVTVKFATADGTAKAGHDYDARSGTITFLPGQTTQTFAITVHPEDMPENAEVFYVNLSSPVNASNSKATGVGTIINDAPPPGILIGNAEVVEGQSGTKGMVFPVTLTNAFALPVTVQYATADGTASVANGDYQSASGTLTFTPGVTTQLVHVLINGDTTVDPDQTFFVNLSNPSNGVLVQDQAVGTIQNGNTTITVNNVVVNQPTSGTAKANFTVSLSAAVTFPVTVHYSTLDGTAVAGTDYATTSGTLTFAPGQKSQTVSVLIRPEAVNDVNESFSLTLSNSVNAAIATAFGTATLINSTPQPSLSINNVTLGDGLPGSTTGYNFTVSLSAASDQIVTVQYKTADDTATTANGDYQAASGTLTFLPGQTSQIVTVLVNGDSTPEADKMFTVNLSSANNATIQNGQGTGTILNDDPNVLVFINNVTMREGSVGPTFFNFTISLSAPSPLPVTVKYHTQDGTATVADNDYVPVANGQVTLNPGQTFVTVQIKVNGDTNIEPDETFFVVLSSPTNGRIATPQGTGTILNDDLGLVINNVTTTEATSGTTNEVFTVTLNHGPATFPVTVQYNTSNGTAIAGRDYVPVSGSLTFNPGQTTQTIAVSIIGSTINKPTEFFNVNLSNSVNAVIGKPIGVGTILNTNPVPSITISDYKNISGTFGTTAFTFTITLSAPSQQTISVHYATADGTATLAENDYQAASGTCNFLPGQTSATITVQVVGTTTFEADETFFVNLSNPINATLANTQGTGTIVSDAIVTMATQPAQPGPSAAAATTSQLNPGPSAGPNTDPSVLVHAASLQASVNQSFGESLAQGKQATDQVFADLAQNGLLAS